METTGMARAQREDIADRAVANLFDAGTRRRLSAPGFRAFVGVADKLDLSVQQRRILLGDIAESTYHKWRSGAVTELTADTLTRISLVLGIFKALRLLFAADDAAFRWLRSANRDLPFAGRSPQEVILEGPQDNLFAVRRYLDAWRGVWP
jgi:hypothetical protein